MSGRVFWRFQIGSDALMLFRPMEDLVGLFGERGSDYFGSLRCLPAAWRTDSVSQAQRSRRRRMNRLANAAVALVRKQRAVRRLKVVNKFLNRSWVNHRCNAGFANGVTAHALVPHCRS
jgi:hypothetical protein